CHAERVFVEGCDLLYVVSGQGYMLDFRHALSPPDAPVRACVTARLRTQSGWGAITRLGTTWRRAIAAGGRSITCDSADRQSWIVRGRQARADARDLPRQCA